MHDTSTGLPRPGRAGRIRPRRVLAALLLALAAAVAAMVGVRWALLGWPWETFRTTAEHDPPVLAGRIVSGACSGGFHARRGDEIVLTLSGHCATEGATLRAADGSVIGVVGRAAREPTCPHAGHSCWPSDLAELVLAPDAVPWGHLDQVDLGAGGYRTLEPGTRPLACEDIRPGELVEMNGRDRFRTGTVIGSTEYLHPPEQDGTYFPCLVVADVGVGVGDSGAAVLVEGQPAGVVSRQVAGRLGFTPLAEGLERLGLTLCTDPDCGLLPPGR